MTSLKGCLKNLCDSDRLISARDPEALKAMCIKEIAESSCNEPDKRKMVIVLQGMTSVMQIQKYIFNAMLKYNRLGVQR